MGRFRLPEEVLPLIDASGVHHEAAAPWAYPVDGRTLRVVLRAARGRVARGRVVYGDRYAPMDEDRAEPLVLAGRDGDFDYFEAEISLDPPRFRYAFLLEGGGGGEAAWLHEQGVDRRRPPTSNFQYPYIHEADIHEPPAWLTKGVVYQVFPDRFEKGNPALDPPDVKPWSDDKPTAASLYGGDLAGIRARLPHLEELGVTVLYLTPIFQSPSNHKYDTTDYFRIDPHFGDEAELRRLVDECHHRGIRVILDAVFNHCGIGFFAFQDVLEKGRDSAYADWFHLHDFPVRTEPTPNYETFANGIASMPKLRTGNPEVRRYLLDVARYWIEKCDIDGWRIDVANEVDHAFWREFRAAVKQVKPDAYIVGEVWHEGLPWLLGDEFDGITNYPVREAVLGFFARGRLDAAGFAAAITRNAFIYPEAAGRASWNLLGSHDTERFVTACGGHRRRAALGVVFNMTWLGTPLVYYGDEIGMEGANDPDCRRPMIWQREKWDQDLFALHRRLIGLRQERSALHRGRARVVLADGADNTLVYVRHDEKTGERVAVAFNNSAAEKVVDLGAPATGTGFPAGTAALGGLRWEPLTGRSATEDDGRLRLGPFSAAAGFSD